MGSALPPARSWKRKRKGLLNLCCSGENSSVFMCTCVESPHHLMSCSNVFLSLLQLHQQGILRTDDLITRFFRISTELCVEVTYRALGDHVSLQMAEIRGKMTGGFHIKLVMYSLIVIFIVNPRVDILLIPDTVACRNIFSATWKFDLITFFTCKWAHTITL